MMSLLKCHTSCVDREDMVLFLQGVVWCVALVINVLISVPM